MSTEGRLFLWRFMNQEWCSGDSTVCLRRGDVYCCQITKKTHCLLKSWLPCLISFKLTSQPAWWALRQEHVRKGIRKTSGLTGMTLAYCSTVVRKMMRYTVCFGILFVCCHHLNAAKQNSSWRQMAFTEMKTQPFISWSICLIELCGWVFHKQLGIGSCATDVQGDSWVLWKKLSIPL